MPQIIKIKRAATTALATQATVQDGEFLFDKESGLLYIGNGQTKTVINPTGGVADTANSLTTPRDFSITGDGTASAVSFNGTQNVQLVLSLVAQAGLTAGPYTKLTVNEKGLVTGAAQLVVSDLPLTFDGTPSGENPVATQTTVTNAVNTAKTELIGTSTTGSTANSIRGAVDEAKGYADTQISAKISSVYKPAGSVAFASLVEPSAAIEGNVYNVTDAFQADTKFVESEQGKNYPAGTNVVCIEVTDGQYAYDVLAGFVDTSNFATKTGLSEAVSGIEGTAEDATTELTLHGIQNLANGIQTELTGLEGQVVAVQGDVSDIKGNITTIESNITDVTNTVNTISEALGVNPEDPEPTFPANIVTSVSAAEGAPVTIGGDGKKVTVAVNVTAGNGLSVTGGNIQMGQGSASVAGAVRVDGTSINAAAGVISVNVIDGGEITE